MSQPLPPYEPDPVTPAQQRTLGWLNDSWGVRRWIGTPDDNLLVICDDGDQALVTRDGKWRWENR